MANPPVHVQWLGPDDGALVAASSHLFDEPPRTDATASFLARPGHHLGLAVLDGRPAGFVSGVEMTHPDKGTEMFLYELGVDESARGRGVGRTLVSALAARSSELGCYGMWVLTDAANDAAMATYRAAGATAESPQVMLEWKFGAADARDRARRSERPE